MATQYFSPSGPAVHKVDVDGAGGAAFQITLDGTRVPLPATGFAIEFQGNYQFLHTVNDFIFVHAFGDRIGEIVVTGMGFFDIAGCNENSMCQILSYYKGKRIAVHGNAIGIKIGQCEEFKGFLTGMRLEASKPEIAVAQWVLRFNALV